MKTKRKTDKKGSKTKRVDVQRRVQSLVADTRRTQKFIDAAALLGAGGHEIQRALGDEVHAPIRIPREWTCPQCGQIETDELAADEHVCDPDVQRD